MSQRPDEPSKGGHVGLPRRWPTIIVAAGATPACALLLLFFADPAFVLGVLRVGLLLIVVGLGAGLALGLLWLYRRVQRAAIVTLQHGQPVHLDDLRALTRATVAATLEQHYAVELARAERSAFPQLSHYSVRQEGGPALAAALPPIIEGEAAAGGPALSGGAVLQRLQAGGQIRPNTLLAGLQGDGGPAPIDMRGCGFIAVGGQSRSGKSTTVALLIAQAALMGWDVALCDPFPHKPDGLISLCRPLSGGVFRQAGAPDEIARTIQLVDKIGRRRLEGDRWEKPLLLVIEEFSNIVIRGMLPAATLDLLPAMAMAYAAVGVHGVIIGHEFSRALLGEKYGATLRRACTHRIAHRLAPDAAEFLLPSAAYARQVVELQPGRALLWGDDSPQLIAVPKVAEADLEYAAQGRTPRPYAPWPAQLAAAPAPPAPTPAPPASLDERIVDLLATGGGPLDGNTIAAQLGADLQQTRNALTRLSHAGRIARHGQPRSYSYSTGECRSSSSPARTDLAF